jgi:hypothetical protein
MLHNIELAETKSVTWLLQIQYIYTLRPNSETATTIKKKIANHFEKNKLRNGGRVN